LQPKDSKKNLSIAEQEILDRADSLINYFTLSLYSNVCRSIFEKDKLLFSFLLTAKIRQSQGKLNQVQYKLLVENIPGHENPLHLVNSSKEWLPKQTWNKLCTCAHRDLAFDSLVKNFTQYDKQWRKLYECEVLTDDIFPPNKDSIKGEWTPFMKLIILKALRPDKLGQAVKEYILHEMGPQFLNPPIFDLDQSFSDSNSGTPLIFVLPGTDPLQQLSQFA
jgi:dynein heavy chain